MKELSFDPRFDRAVWRIQRAGWAGMAVVAVAAAAGLMGDGPLSGAEAHGRTVQLRYSRFLRNRSDSIVEVRVPRENRSIRLSMDYLRRFEVAAVTPEPSTVYTSGSDVVYTFPGPATAIWLRMQPKDAHFEWIQGTLATDVEEVTFRQFVWP